MKQLRILVVDDNQGIRTAIIRLLVCDLLVNSYEEASDIVTAMDKIQQSTFDLIILDLNLQGYSGLDFLRELRQKNIATPTLIVSMYPASTYKQDCLDLGAAGYIEKHVAADVLSAEVRRLAESAYP